MNKIAHELNFLFQQIAKTTVVVQNNNSLSKSRKVCAFWKHWAKPILLFLLPDRFDFNLIETRRDRFLIHEIDLRRPIKRFPQNERVSITEQIDNKDDFDFAMRVIREMENHREIDIIN